VKRPAPRDSLALALLLVPYLALVNRFWFVCDDAFITFRYSRNWAQGHGPRYNLGDEVPVEGYSDFLWMAYAAVLEALHLDVAFWTPLASAGCGVVLLGLVYAALRTRVGLDTPMAFAVGLILACFTPFAVWSTSGLETMPQALLMFATWLLVVDGRGERSAWAGGVTALLLALVRTEGIAWAGVLGGLAAVQRWLLGRPLLRPLLGYAGILAVGYGSYFAWRYGYYQSLVANTALAKVHMEAETLVRGLRYLALYVATMLSPLLLLAAIPAGLLSKHRVPALTAGAMALGVPAYAVAVSGDYMTYFRILVPGVAFMVLSFGFAVAWLLESGRVSRQVVLAACALTASLGVLPALEVHLVPESMRDPLQVRDKLTMFRSENRQWDAMVTHGRTWREKGEALAWYAKPDETLVAAAIGHLGYYSNLYIYDRNGLVNREVALLPWNGELRSPGHDKVVDRSFFFDKQPDLLDAKVVSGTDLGERVKYALREMEASKVKKTYYPDMVRLPGERRRPRYLIALRRAENPEQADEKWDVFRTQLKALSNEEIADE
jgi:arabinofuranosyltransferase